MNRVVTILVAAACGLAPAAVLLVPAAAGAAPQAARPKLVVMEVKAVQGLPAGAGGTLSAILASDAARAGFEVVSQADVTAMLAFQKQRQMLGCTDEGCLAELGGALGADYVLAGEASRVGSRDHLALTLLEPRRARVLGRAAGFTEAGDDNLAVAAQVRFRTLLRQERPDLALRLPPVLSPAAARAQTRRTAAWWTLGAGGALLAGGGVVGLLARSQADDLRSTAWREPGYQAAYDKQRRTARTADVLLGAGALAAGVGGVLWLTSSPPVVVAPVASRDGAGLVLAGRF